MTRLPPAVFSHYLNATRAGHIVITADFDVRTFLMDYIVELYSHEAPSHYVIARHRHHLEYTGAHQSRVFHFIWSTPAASFQDWRLHVLKRLRTFHPWAKIVVHTNTLATHAAVASYADQFMPIHDTLFTSTPLSPWWSRVAGSFVELYNGRAVPEGEFFYSHVTDAIRLAVLYKYGGVYLDFDMLTVQNLFAFRNAMGVQHPKIPGQLNFAAAIFDRGHPFLWAMMYTFPKQYNAKDWVSVGPALVSTVAQLWGRCGMAVREPAPRPSKPWVDMRWFDIHIYPTTSFYPIFLVDIMHGANDAAQAQHYAGLIKNASVVHMWTKVGWHLNKAQNGSILASLFNALRLARIL